MIDTQQALVAFCQRAQEAECLALDTEFVWNRTYYPKLCTQVGLSAEDRHLIDAPVMKTSRRRSNHFQLNYQDFTRRQQISLS